MRPLKRPRLNAGTVVAGAENATKNYRDFAQRLIEKFGPYCAFCESPLPGGWGIEHRCAQSTTKGRSQDIVNDWGNLLVACLQCNGTKGDRIKEEKDMCNVVWPDVHNTLLMFRFRADGVIEVDSDNIKKHLPSLHYGVDKLSDADRNDIAERLSAKAENTIRVFDLNKVAPYDGRLGYRRQTYELALTFFERNIGPQPDLFRSMTKATGCWSIWCQILSDPAAKIDDKVARSYLRELLDGAVFPGTSEAISVEDNGSRLKFELQEKEVEIIYGDRGYNAAVSELPSLSELKKFVAEFKEPKPPKKEARPPTRTSPRDRKVNSKYADPPGDKEKILSHRALSSSTSARAEPKGHKRKRDDAEGVVVTVNGVKFAPSLAETSEKDSDVEMMLDDESDSEEAARPHKKSKHDDA